MLEGVNDEKISLDKAIALLKKDGIIVNEEQAKCILDFLMTMAGIVVSQYLRKSQKSK
nr:hypothetical protein [Mucilaginibacter sp. L294]